MIRTEPIRLTFRYAAGETGSRFLAALRDAQSILGSGCEACDRVRCPPSSFCPDCGEATSTLIDVGPDGRVISWTEIPGRGLFGLIRLDGADTAMLHRLIGPSEAWAVGARVSARFAGERCGSVLDIEGFVRLEVSDR